jgi:3-dehydroquinate synthase
MICESYLSVKKSGLPKPEMELIHKMLLKVYGKFNFPAEDIPAIVALCSQDKKNEGKTLNFSLLTQIGKCEYNFNVTVEEILESVHFYKNL